MLRVRDSSGNPFLRNEKKIGTNSPLKRPKKSFELSENLNQFGFSKCEYFFEFRLN